MIAVGARRNPSRAIWTFRAILMNADVAALLDEIADPLLLAAMMIVRARLDELDAKGGVRGG